MRRITALTLFVVFMAARAHPASAQTNWGVAATRSGEIYFCDPARNTVWKVTSAGVRTAALEATRCRALVTGPDEAIYGESVPTEFPAATGMGLWRLGANGGRQWLLPPSNAPDISIWLTSDHQGRRYSWAGEAIGSVRSEIIRRTPEGVQALFAGGRWGQRDGVGTTAEFGNVGGMAIAPDQSLLVADSGNVRRISPGGDVRTEAVGVITDSHLGITSRQGLWARELGMATDLDGGAVVVDPEKRRIISVDRTGQPRVLWVSSGLGWRPAGVALLGRTFYVLEERPLPGVLADLVGTPRLLHVDESGRVTRVLTVSNSLVRIAFGVMVVIVISGVSSWVRRRGLR